MNDLSVLAAVSLFILLLGMVSKRIARTVLTAPMIFVAFGALMRERFLGLFHAARREAIERGRRSPGHHLFTHQINANAEHHNELSV